MPNGSKKICDIYNSYFQEYKNLSESLLSSQFDPQIGFTLSYKNSADVLGRYRCSLQNDDDEGDSLEVVVKGPKAESSKYLMFCVILWSGENHLVDLAQS